MLSSSVRTITLKKLKKFGSLFLSGNKNQIFHYFWEVVSLYKSVKLRWLILNLLAKRYWILDFLWLLAGSFVCSSMKFKWWFPSLCGKQYCVFRNFLEGSPCEITNIKQFIPSCFRQKIRFSMTYGKQFRPVLSSIR